MEWLITSTDRFHCMPTKCKNSMTIFYINTSGPVYWYWAFLWFMKTQPNRQTNWKGVPLPLDWHRWVTQLDVLAVQNMDSIPASSGHLYLCARRPSMEPKFCLVLGQRFLDLTENKPSVWPRNKHSWPIRWKRKSVGCFLDKGKKSGKKVLSWSPILDAMVMTQCSGYCGRYEWKTERLDLEPWYQRVTKTTPELSSFWTSMWEQFPICLGHC